MFRRVWWYFCGFFLYFFFCGSCTVWLETPSPTRSVSRDFHFVDTAAAVWWRKSKKTRDSVEEVTHKNRLQYKRSFVFNYDKPLLTILCFFFGSLRTRLISGSYFYFFVVKRLLYLFFFLKKKINKSSWIRIKIILQRRRPVINYDCLCICKQANTYVLPIRVKFDRFWVQNFNGISYLIQND